MEKSQLINFEKDIANLYTQGKIKAPVHLRDENEDILINIFQTIKPEDYVFSTWASHLHAILKGVPQENIKNDILNGNSICLQYPKYNFYTSAIVGGTCPIATGVAKGIKLSGENRRVYIFIGDMAAMTGIANESIKYSFNHDLPITWIIEDNHLSVESPTDLVWGTTVIQEFEDKINFTGQSNAKIVYYLYTKTYPHAGTGVFVHF